MSVLGKNIVWLFVSQLATWLVSAVLLIWAPNRFGADEYGRLSLATGFVGFFQLVGLLGTTQYMTRILAREPHKIGLYVYNSFLMKAVFAVVLTSAAVGVGAALGYDSRLVLLIAIGMVTVDLNLLNDTLSAGLGSLERMSTLSFWLVVQTYVGGLLAAGTLLVSRSTVAFSLALAVAGVIPIVGNGRHLRSHLRGQRHLRVSVWREIALGGLPLLALTGLNMVYGSIDIPILSALSDTTTVGWYAIAYRWVGIPVFISTIVMYAFFPQLSKLAVTAADEFVRLTNRALRLVCFVAIPASMGIIIVAPDLFHAVYGSKYDEAVPLVRILSTHIPLAAMDTVLATALIASDMQRRYLYVAATAAVFNPLLNVALIRFAVHRFDNGAIASSAITVATEVFIMFGALRLRTPGIMDRTTVWFAIRCVVAALAMLGTLLIFPGDALILKALVALPIYGVMSVLLRTASKRHLSALRNQLKGVMPTRG